MQAGMDPAMIVMFHELDDRLVRLCITLELVARQAVILEDSVERFDVRVHVRRPRWNSLVFQSKLSTCGFKQVAHELGPVVRADDRQLLCLAIELAFPQGSLQCIHSVCGLAVQSDVVIHSLTVKDVYVRQHEEKSVLTRDVAILDIHLPELIGCRDISVSCQFPRMLLLHLSLGLEHAKVLAEPIHFLLVDHESMLLAQKVRELQVTIGISLSFNGFHNPLLDLFIADFIAILGMAMLRHRTSPSLRPWLWLVALVKVIGGSRDPHNAQHDGDRVPGCDPLVRDGYFIRK